MFEEWTIKNVKYKDGTIFIKFMDANDAEYSLKSEDPARPEFMDALRHFRDCFRSFESNPILDSPSKMAIHTIGFKYKDDQLNSFAPTCTVRSKNGFEGELAIAAIAYPTNNKDINASIFTIIQESNQYIAGHRAQMGLFDGEEE